MPVSLPITTSICIRVLLLIYPLITVINVQSVGFLPSVWWKIHKQQINKDIFCVFELNVCGLKRGNWFGVNKAKKAGVRLMVWLAGILKRGAQGACTLGQRSEVSLFIFFDQCVG